MAAQSPPESHMPSVLSPLKIIVSALRRWGWRRKALAGVLVIAAGAGACLLLADRGGAIDPVNGKKEVSRTTYRSHDGAYQVIEITYSDGSKREIRPEGPEAKDPKDRGEP
jgi:hypothetical protein